MGLKQDQTVEAKQDRHRVLPLGSVEGVLIQDLALHVLLG
jgi:hypothetical protein